MNELLGGGGLGGGAFGQKTSLVGCNEDALDKVPSIKANYMHII